MLSYLFMQRHEIAFALGIADEVPIALCNSSYFDSQELKISTPDEDDSVPSGWSHAPEIVLFFSSTSLLSDNTNHPAPTEWLSFFRTSHYRSPSLDIFPPPRV